jgi:hypothetical protein
MVAKLGPNGQLLPLIIGPCARQLLTDWTKADYYYANVLAGGKVGCAVEK